LTEHLSAKLLKAAKAPITNGLLARWDSNFNVANFAHQIEAASIARQTVGGEPNHFLVILAGNGHARLASRPGRPSLGRVQQRNQG